MLEAAAELGHNRASSRGESGGGIAELPGTNGYIPRCPPTKRVAIYGVTDTAYISRYWTTFASLGKVFTRVWVCLYISRYWTTFGVCTLAVIGTQILNIEY